MSTNSIIYNVKVTCHLSSLIGMVQSVGFCTHIILLIESLWLTRCVVVTCCCHLLFIVGFTASCFFSLPLKLLHTLCSLPYISLVSNTHLSNFILGLKCLVSDPFWVFPIWSNPDRFSLFLKFQRVCCWSPANSVGYFPCAVELHVHCFWVFLDSLINTSVLAQINVYVAYHCLCPTPLSATLRTWRSSLCATVE